MGDTAGQHQVSLREKKTGARQRFLRRSRALTVTISIPGQQLQSTITPLPRPAGPRGDRLSLR